MSALTLMDSSRPRPSGEPRDDHGAATMQVALERDPLAPARARAVLADFSRARDLSTGSRETLSLLVSELVSNAVVHSDAPPASNIELCARVVGSDAIRIEVTDYGSGFSAVPRDPTRTEGGYGLFLVDSQAASWGIDRRCGNQVWFEVAEPPRRVAT